MTDELNDSRESAEETTIRSGRVNPAGSEAIKWGAIVLIVLAILYFLARYVVPLF